MDNVYARIYRIKQNVPVMNAYDIGMLESKYLPDENIQRLQIIAKQDKNIINVVGEPPTKFTPDARLHLLKVSFEFVCRLAGIQNKKTNETEMPINFINGFFCLFTTKTAMELVIIPLVVIMYFCSIVFISPTN